MIRKEADNFFHTLSIHYLYTIRTLSMLKSKGKSACIFLLLFAVVLFFVFEIGGSL